MNEVERQYCIYKACTHNHQIFSTDVLPTYGHPVYGSSSFRAFRRLPWSHEFVGLFSCYKQEAPLALKFYSEVVLGFNGCK